MASSSEERQKDHYDRIFPCYESHYDDSTAQEYRRRFIYDTMLHSVDLKGANVLEAMCGSGQATGYLLERGAQVTGLDISETAMAAFASRWPMCDAICASILIADHLRDAFDLVLVVGGLHHVHPYVRRAVDVIHGMLKPGGLFCFVEPHRESLLDVARRIWYRLDRRMFAEGEAAIDLEALKRHNVHRFAFEQEVYFGGPGYFLILNSMVFRIPVRWKQRLATWCFKVEGFLKPVQNRYIAPAVLCVWRKA